MTQGDDRAVRKTQPEPKGRREDSGPSKPSVKRPEGDELMKRLKRVDPDQAKKYRQRSGQ